MKKSLVVFIIAFCMVLCACGKDNTFDEPAKKESSLEIKGGVNTDQLLNYNSTSAKAETTDSEVNDDICTNNSTNEIQHIVSSDFNNIESNQKESASECNCKCHCSNIRIDMADAILIAQNHLFAMLPPEFSLEIAYSAWYLSDNEESWTILVGQDDVNPNDEYIYNVKGGSYIYVINKFTGKILEIRSGE